MSKIIIWYENNNNNKTVIIIIIIINEYSKKKKIFKFYSRQNLDLRKNFRELLRLKFISVCPKINKLSTKINK